MKKYFLSFAVIGALFMTGGYADGQQSILVSYTCPDTCTVTNDTDLTKFGCVYPDTKDCGTPTAKILEPMPIKEIPAPVAKEPEKSKPIAARAAKKQNVKPSGNKPNNPDMAGNGSGWWTGTCPRGCEPDCKKYRNQDGTTSLQCECYTSSGKICEDRVSQGTTQPVGF